MEKEITLIEKEGKDTRNGLFQDKLDSDVMDHLSSIEEGLLSISLNAESNFMEVGERLQKGYELVRALTHKTIEIGRLIDGDSEENPLHRIEALVNHSLVLLKNCRDNALSKLNPVKTVLDYFEQLDSRRIDIERIARYLRSVALNIFIETSRCECLDENFLAIAREIKQLSENIIRTAKNFHEIIIESKNRFQSMYTDISDNLVQIGSLVRLAEVSAKDSVLNTNQLVDFSFSMVEKAGVMSEKISREVEEIVMGIQFHDAMAQRIEHIISGLKDAASLCHPKISPGKDNTQKDFTNAHAVITLQCAQIDQIINEVDEVHSRSRIAFENITKDIFLMAQNFSQVFDPPLKFPGTVQKRKDWFCLLSSELSNIQSLESQGNDLENRLAVIYEKALETAADLSSLTHELHNISQESQNKALNSMIAASRMGFEGRTLSVLAKEMKSLSSHAYDTITGVDEIIDMIVSTIHGVKLERTFEYHSKDETSPPMENILNSIFTLYEQIKEQSSGACEISTDLTTVVAKTKNRLDFLPVMSRELETQMAWLNEVKTVLQPWIDESASARITDSYMAERYTMEEEYRVHKKSMAKACGIPAPEEKKIENSYFHESDCDFFDNALFENSSETQDLADNIELF